MEPVPTSPGRAPDRLFAILLAAVAALRLALLFASQGALLGDEATVGLMAKHILERGERPIFAYGADYNGGSALTAYVATIPFSIFGVTETALKLVPLAFSLMAVVAVYWLVRTTRGPGPALLAALVYATSVCLMKWSFDARGAYAECQALVPLALWMLHARCLRRAASLGDDLLLGALAGFGVYLLETSLPLAAVAFVFLALRDWPARRFGGVLAFAAGAVAGCAPLVLLGRGASSLNPLALPAALRHVPWRLWKALTAWIPGSLAYDNLEAVPPVRLAPNGIEYAFLLAGIAAVVVLRRDALRGWRGRLARGEAPPPIEVLLLAYLAAFLLLFCLHPLAGQDARPFVFLEPACSILAALGLYECARRRSPWPALVLAIGAASLVDRAVQHVRLFSDDTLDGPLGHSEPRTADAMIAFLDAQGARGVMTDDWDLSWRIVFKSGERIAACRSLEGVRRAPAEQLEKGGRFGIVLNPGTPREEALARRLANKSVPVERHSVAGKTVYLLGTAGAATDPAWCPTGG